MPNDRIIDLVNDLLLLWDPSISSFTATSDDIDVIMSELEQLTTNMQYEEVEVETTQEEMPDDNA